MRHRLIIIFCQGGCLFSVRSHIFHLVTMTKSQPESFQFVTQAQGSNTSFMWNGGTLMDFNFYPVKQGTDDILTPIPIDVETDFTNIFDIDDLSCVSEPSFQTESCQSSVFSDSLNFMGGNNNENWSSASAESASSSLSAHEEQRFKAFHEEKWNLRFKELLAFFNQHGHAAVPHTYPENPQLARWVKRQRRQYKLLHDGQTSTMTTERLDMLNEVGFVWDSHDVNWREKLDSLISFRRCHGHSNVPSNHKDKKLATWVKCQRRQYKLFCLGKSSAMTNERIKQLESVGFEWEIRSVSPRKKCQ